jgi:hypothetical protein
MFETFNKRGNRSKVKASVSNQESDVTPRNAYAAVNFGGGRPDESRRFTNSYGKTAGKRAEYKPEVGLESSMTARLFNMAKDGINKYRGF